VSERGPIVVGDAATVEYDAPPPLTPPIAPIDLQTVAVDDGGEDGGPTLRAQAAPRRQVFPAAEHEAGVSERGPIVVGDAATVEYEAPPPLTPPIAPIDLQTVAVDDGGVDGAGPHRGGRRCGGRTGEH
jgi:hypothetical protein